MTSNRESGGHLRSIFRFPLESGRAQISSPVSIKFETTGTILVKNSAGEIETEEVRDLEVEVRLVPETAESPHPRGKSEWIELHMAGAPERYFPFAQQFATEAIGKLAFFYPGLAISGGFSEGERVPETEDEAAAVGDKRHVVNVSLREVDGPISLSRDHVTLLPFMSGLERIIRQYTTAREARNPIDGYLGMFKVLETLYYRGKGHTIAVLKQNSELREVLRHSYRTRQADDEPWREPDDRSIDSMIEDMVRTRDQCAHLRDHNAFGYAPGDMAVFRDVEPMFGIVAGAAREAIRGRVDAASGGRLKTMYGLGHNPDDVPPNSE